MTDKRLSILEQSSNVVIENVEIQTAERLKFSFSSICQRLKHVLVSSFQKCKIWNLDETTKSFDYDFMSTKIISFFYERMSNYSRSRRKFIFISKRMSAF
jgi:hypothetical protein